MEIAGERRMFIEGVHTLPHEIQTFPKNRLESGRHWFQPESKTRLFWGSMRTISGLLA